MGKLSQMQGMGLYAAANATDREPLTLDSSSGEPIPSPSTKKREKFIRLTTLGDIRQELAHLYRQTKAGKIETSDASRLAFILNSLGRVIVDADLEARIQQLEENLAEEK